MKNNIFLYLFIFITTLTIACKKDDVPTEDPFVIPATEDIIMYEINHGAFSVSKDLQGIIDRLDSIKALGINTIWLMPIHPTGIINSFGSPYCVRDFTAVNSGLGTLEDLKNLVNEAHERDIAVLLDWIANHTAWDNAWINNDGWYTEDINGNIISPEGTTWTDVADLNFDNADMRLAMIDAMEYWIENANIDGYRCDAADFVPFDFWQQAIDSLNNFADKDLILLAEGARPDHFTAGFQMNFSWSYLTTLKTVFNTGGAATMIFTASNNEYGIVPEGKHKLRFTTNHDESNISTPIIVFGGKAAATAASAITIFLEGVPLIYCGQEVGVSSTTVYNGNYTIDWTANADMLTAYKFLLNYYKGSDAARKGALETFNHLNIAMFKKTYDTEQIAVLVNTRETSQSFAVPVNLQGDWVNAFNETQIILSDSLTLLPYEYWILEN